MPPRKRAESKPNEPVLDADVPAGDEEQAETPAETPTPDPEAEPAPAKSDLQTAERPCVECFPDGWTEQVFSLGCTHGTWVKN